MIEKMKTEAFGQIFSIMQDSFPKDEYRPFAEQQALLRHPGYQIYILPEKETEIIKAFVAVWRFTELTFIEHFAVNPAFRNQGLGTVMLQELKHFITGRICLEVEPPENDLSRRRIAFYQRNGFFLNQMPYIQPAISKGKKPLPLFIMTTDGPVTEREFLEIRTLLYREVYHVSKEDTGNTAVTITNPSVKSENSG